MPETAGPDENIGESTQANGGSAVAEARRAAEATKVADARIEQALTDIDGRVRTQVKAARERLKVQAERKLREAASTLKRRADARAESLAAEATRELRERAESELRQAAEE